MRVRVHLVIASLVAVGMTTVTSARADTIERAVPIDKDGTVSVGALVSVILGEVVTDLTLRIPPTTFGGRVAISGDVGEAFLIISNLTLGQAGISLSPVGDNLVISVDRAELGRRVDEVEHGLRALFGGGPPRYRLVRHAASTTGGPPVVLMHGLNSSPKALSGAARIMATRGYDVYLAHYPDDGRIEASAGALGHELRLLHKQTNKRLSVVTTSMGAVVVRTYLELDPRYAGEIERFIAVTPPFAGSPLARFHPIYELGETLSDLFGDEGVAGLFPFDGFGQGAADLIPGSMLLDQLALAKRRAGTHYAIIAGDGDVIAPHVVHKLREAITREQNKQGPEPTALVGLVHDVISALASVSGLEGDGVVTMSSQSLAGVSDRVVRPCGHLACLAGDGQRIADIPGLQDVLLRLPKP